MMLKLLLLERQTENNIRRHPDDILLLHTKSGMVKILNLGHLGRILSVPGLREGLNQAAFADSSKQKAVG